MENWKLHCVDGRVLCLVGGSGAGSGLFVEYPRGAFQGHIGHGVFSRREASGHGTRTLSSLLWCRMGLQASQSHRLLPPCAM